MLGISCSLQGMGRELPDPQTQLTAKQKWKASFIIQFHSKRRRPEEKLCHVENGWSDSQLYFQPWASTYQDDSGELYQSWNPTLLSVSYLGECVWFCCLHSCFLSLHHPWLTFPPVGIVWSASLQSQSCQGRLCPQRLESLLQR